MQDNFIVRVQKTYSHSQKNSAFGVVVTKEKSKKI